MTLTPQPEPTDPVLVKCLAPWCKSVGIYKMDGYCSEMCCITHRQFLAGYEAARKQVLCLAGAQADNWRLLTPISVTVNPAGIRAAELEGFMDEVAAMQPEVPQ